MFIFVFSAEEPEEKEDDGSEEPKQDDKLENDEGTSLMEHLRINLQSDPCLINIK